MCGEKLSIYIDILKDYLYNNTYMYDITNINITDEYIIAHCREYSPSAVYSARHKALGGEYDLIVRIDKEDNVYIKNIYDTDLLRDFGEELGRSEDDIKNTCEKYKEMVKKFKKEKGCI